MRVNELKNAMKMSVTAEGIAGEMKEICTMVDEIIREEKLLELEYYPSDGKID